jgi:hypothetical protein
MSKNDNLSAVLDMAIRNRLAEVHTAAPGIIISYDFKTQKASVRPSINRKYKDGRVERYPVINNVPVIFPRSGGASMTFPVNPNDTVLLVFAARSIDDWAQRGGYVDQSDTRKHSLNDAIAIPGLIPFSAGSKAKNNTDVLVTYSGAEIEMKPSGQINLNSPVKVFVDAPLLHVNGEIYAESDITTKTDLYDYDREFGSSSDHREKYNNHQHEENGNGNLTDDPEDQYKWI